MDGPAAQPFRSLDALGIELDDLRLFTVLAEELHFGRAARRSHLSQPGLSYRIRRLEEALGSPVLQRDRQGVRLTPAGTALLEGARRLLGEAARVVDDSRRAARGELATVRFGVVGTALFGLLPPMLARLRVRHPGLSVVVQELKTSIQVQALGTGELDVGLLHLPVPTGAGLQMEPLMSDAVGLALPVGHELAGRDRIDLADVADDSFVLFPRELEPDTHDNYVGACVAAGFAPRVAHVATGLQTILALVASGAGVAFVADSVAGHLQRSGVVFVPLNDGPVLVTGLAWSPEQLRPGVELVREAAVASHIDRAFLSLPQELRLD